MMTDQQAPVLTLTRARELAAGSIDSLAELGQLVFAMVYATREVPVEFASITWRPSQRRHADVPIPKHSGCWEWHDLHGGCVVYCDPPGACAPCGTTEPSALAEVILDG